MSQTVIYRSKISYWLFIPLISVCVVLGLIPVIKGAPNNVVWLMSTLSIGAAGFVVHAFLSTRYWVNENQELRIKAGFMTDLTIPVSEIRSIKKTNNLLASPAASFDRIEIKYGKWNEVMISPKDKRGLINELRNINPEIGVNLNPN